MSPRVFVFRPEPGFSATLAAGQRLGLVLIGEPLFVIEPVTWDMPAGDFDGLLVGSANAFRNGGAKLAALRHLPVFAVGAATAREAEAMGFAVERVGDGGLQAVLNGLADQPLSLLRLAGEERVALKLPPAISMAERVVYRSAPRTMTADTVDVLRKGGTVLLHSAIAGQHFAAQCDLAGVDRAGLHIAALAPRVAQSVGSGWAEVAIAEEADDMALLALARDMCDKIAGLNG
ncbi:uroporphyrinogen-III synthase [Parerythrobacter lacustris]|uniref:Uroporphyrinogen-III synthase n=1 Tax=Parerythrobacter lacustris TaxID=2969984 RepID=A0ABT1XRY4_9SPHN|nr:uroporphyrinogen-III synthase [Parerythrobacter lacustris]MCR2833177.1 uroporphyrinogen-III synthase [Parerythrobacter lacustris]